MAPNRSSPLISQFPDQRGEVAVFLNSEAAGNGGTIVSEQGCVAPSRGKSRVSQACDQRREVAPTSNVLAAGAAALSHLTRAAWHLLR